MFPLLMSKSCFSCCSKCLPATHSWGEKALSGWCFFGFFPKLNPTPFFPLWISLFFSDNKGIPFVIVVCFCGLMWGKREKYFAWGIWIGDLIAKGMRQSSNRFFLSFFVKTRCDGGVTNSPRFLTSFVIQFCKENTVFFLIWSEAPSVECTIILAYQLF